MRQGLLISVACLNLKLVEQVACFKSCIPPQSAHDSLLSKWLAAVTCLVQDTQDKCSMPTSSLNWSSLHSIISLLPAYLPPQRLTYSLLVPSATNEPSPPTTQHSIVLMQPHEVQKWWSHCAHLGHHTVARHTGQRQTAEDAEKKAEKKAEK